MPLDFEWGFWDGEGLVMVLTWISNNQSRRCSVWLEDLEVSSLERSMDVKSLWKSMYVMYISWDVHLAGNIVLCVESFLASVIFYVGLCG